MVGDIPKMNARKGGNQESNLGKQWKAIACKETGTSHISDKKPCQDHADYKQYKEYFIGAVSDGAGSRTLSQYGSKLAVDTTLDYFVDKLEHSRRGSNPLGSKTDVEALFRELIDTIRDKIQKKAEAWSNENNDKISPIEFACTLLVFIAFPKGIAAMQLGDGFIVVRKFKDKEYNLLCDSTKDEDQPVNYTTFVTSARAEIEKDLQIVYSPNPVSFVCASTDGLESVALDLVNQKAYPRFFIPLEQYIQETEELELEKDVYIPNFLKSELINRKTDDDKTILLCANVNSVSADPAPQITPTTPTSKHSNPLPPTTTQPPIVDRHPKNPDKIQPSGKRAPKSGRQEIDPPLAPLDDNIITSTNISVQKTETKNSRLLVGLFLLSNFLCVYFAVIGTVYVVEKINQNRPDLEIIITIVNNKLTLGSIPTLIAGIGVIVLLIYFIVAGLYASEDPNDKNNKDKEIHDKKKFLNLVVKFNPNIGEVFAFCLPLIATVLAFLTASSINNGFPNISKPTTVSHPTIQPSSLPPKTDPVNKTKDSQNKANDKTQPEKKSEDPLDLFGSGQ